MAEEKPQEGTQTEEQAKKETKKSKKKKEGSGSWIIR